MKRLAIYLAVTFGLSWGLWIPSGIALDTFVNGESSSYAMIAIIAVSMFFPLIGAFVANFACKPEERINLALRPRIRGNVKYYLAAWFMPTLVALLGCVLYFVTNPQEFTQPDMSALAVQAMAQGVVIPNNMPFLIGITVIVAVLFAPFINMIPAFGEEVGWRGMLFPTLAERMSTRTAAVVSGVIWGVWHAPIIAMGHNYGMDYLGFPLAGMASMILLCTAFACCMAYLRLRTESVWPCALAHGAFNAIAGVGVYFCVSGPSILGPSALALVAGIPLLALGVVCLVKLPAKEKRESGLVV